MFSKLLSYWKTLLLEIFEVGWTLAGSTILPLPPYPPQRQDTPLTAQSRARTAGGGGGGAGPPQAPLLMVEQAVGLQGLKGKYLNRGIYCGKRLWRADRAGTCCCGIPFQCFVSWRWYTYHKLRTSHLCGKSPKASCRPLIA